MKKKINIIILLVLFMSSCGDSNNGSIDNYFFNNVVKPPITSLDGLWESSDCKVAISGNSGTVVEVNSSSYINLVNLGLVKIGDLKIKNIATYANLKWSCDMLIQVGDNIQWLSGILTLGSDGKTFTVQIGSGPNIFASESFNRINTTNDKPVLSTTSLKSIGSNTATFTTILLSDGGNAITSKGVCWGTSTNPTISNSKTSDGSGSGKFESNITGLTANSSYYVSAYATNAKGTSYSNQVQLVTLPIVNLGLVDDLTYSGVTVSGNIPTQGNNAITEYGICWGTSTGPTVSTNKVAGNNLTNGSFSCALIGLTANTKYYVKSYITNSTGTNYSTETNFTTPTDPFTVSYGLLAFYNFDNQNANDALGNYNGVGVGGLTYTTNSLNSSGYSAQLNGTSSYINIPYQILPSTGSWSYSIWIKTNKNTFDLFSINTCGIYIDSNSKLVLFKDSWNYSFANNLSGNLLNNLWHSLILCYDGSTYKYYIDGTLQEDKYFNIGAWYNNNYTRIGANGSANAYFFSGLLDNIRLYNRALTTTEITTLYNAKQ